MSLEITYYTLRHQNTEKATIISFTNWKRNKSRILCTHRIIEWNKKYIWLYWKSRWHCQWTRREGWLPDGDRTPFVSNSTPHCLLLLLIALASSNYQIIISIIRFHFIVHTVLGSCVWHRLPQSHGITVHRGIKKGATINPSCS